MLTEDLKQKMQEIIDGCMGDAPAACVATCPVHTDAKGYIKLIREGDYKGAVKLIREKLPFPAIMGRICAHPCEEKCKRGEVDEAMSIAALKRFAAEYDDEKDWDLTTAPLKKEKVAIIGAGPAGAMAAYELRKRGYQVTIFEKLDVVGGMLRVGIPAYRLPRNIIDFEFSILEKLGVEIKTGVEVGKDISMDDLRKQFDAIFIAIGAHVSIMLSLPGSDLKGVLPGVDFLRKVSLGQPVDELGKKVLVVGGGNVAIDVARSARRLGAEVEMVCLEQKDEMPAHSWEVEEAEEEGIRIHNGWGPVEYLGENGRVTGLKVKECTRVFDAEGRFNPEYNDNNTKVIEADTVIMAIGQTSDSQTIAEQLGLKVGRGGKFEVNPITLETNVEGVFAGGDCAGRPLIAIEAVAQGLKAAISIDKYFKGEDLTVGREYEGTFDTWLEKDLPKVQRKKRVQMSMLDPEERIKSFDEVALGFTEEQALKEADRCLECECKLCVKECEFLSEYSEHPKELMKRILKDPNADIKIPYYCNLCDICTVHCPKDFKISEIMLELRRIYNRENIGPLPEHKPVTNFHQKLGYNKFFTLTQPDTKAGYTKRVFFPGCSLSSYSPELVIKTLKHLQDRLPGTGFILRCCGAPTNMLGQEKEFEERFNSLLREMEKLGADEIICACPDCTHNIEHHAPHLKVRSLYDVLAEVGLPEEAKNRGQGKVFSIHDSCTARHYTSIHDSVRKLMKEMGFKIQELKYIRENTRCCGMGGMVLLANKELAQRIMVRRTKETDKPMVTYCAACREAMTMGGKPAFHILDLIFKDDWKKGDAPGLGNPVVSWLNRRKTRSRVKKLK
ncbi:pyridine nucleotide-disulfide oxidoreductase [Anoxybacter fermentans]|uniref:Pyridine nucleotide-disulfide oxidoreductase n=1 Tax=Anoxybacter fermentans TaxID=1323375 RepID=A0A3Q9HNN0_9FIRM|nr:FAD-dependent oxidoreductase [Anoxybacter fermentans]AZR72149.1 pyridine nucleotide-disulfide oxidoreductase [Anoxybacter fermentans]